MDDWQATCTDEAIMGEPTRALLLWSVIAALTLTLAPVAMAQGREGPPPPRDEACERTRGTPGRPPFCQEYPPSQRDVACDRSQAPPGRPPFCRAISLSPGSQASVQLRGPWQSQASMADAFESRVREYTVPVDHAGVARFEAPEDLDPGHYQVTFAPAGAAIDLVWASQSFQVITAAATQPQPAPPASGPVLTNGLLAAAAAAVAGATLLVAARRRGANRAGTDPRRVTEG